MSVFGKLLGFLALTAGIFFLAVVLLNPDTSFRDWVYCLPLRIESATPAEVRICETSTPWVMERWDYGDAARHDAASRALAIERARGR
ncbi:hypothetical protein K2X96_02835 [Patescibacteria group bacterium]|nr:hypothetical protein [Patescibacteria group bacterium]